MFLWLQMFEGYFANVGEDWAGKHKKNMVFDGFFRDFSDPYWDWDGP